MQRNHEKSWTGQRRGASSGIPSPVRTGHRAILALVLVAAVSQSACLFKGSKNAVMPSAPVRVAFLPFNTPEGDTEFRWASLAMPVMLAMVAKDAQALEPVPLWESMRVTLESVRNSRTVTQRDAAYVANWLNLKWAVIGDLSGKSGEMVTLLVDFIPPQDEDIPFRYIKKARIDAFDVHTRKSFKQFLEYISAPPMDDVKGRHIALPSLRQLSEALDREYGWTVTAEPGNAQEIVANLAQSDMRLARFLFSPRLYPAIENP